MHDEVDSSSSSTSSSHYRPPTIRISSHNEGVLNELAQEEEKDDWGKIPHGSTPFTTPVDSPHKEPSEAGRFPSANPPPPRDPPAKDRETALSILLKWSEGHIINQDIISDQHKIHDSVIIKMAHVVQKSNDRDNPSFVSEMTYFLHGAACQAAALSSDRYESTIERMANLLSEHTKALRSIKDDNKQMV